MKLVIFGLDCAAPQLIFDAWRDDLPHLSRLMEHGVWGPLTSTIPPVTVPAWMSMMTSHDPGMLGLYGFRNRQDYSYENLFIANSSHIKARTVWNHLSRHRLSSLIMGVPLTYPPKPLNGALIASFLTPDKSADFTHPPELKAELESAADGDYIIDVQDFRTEDKDRLLDAIDTMTRRRFKAFRHLAKRDVYDFAMLVEMGPDRMHHGFWRFHDPAHRLYQEGNKYESAIHDYYVLLDEELGRTLEQLPEDVSVMVVSDHGAKSMTGAICINEWLISEGLLTLKQPPDEPSRLDRRMIDWSQTKVWGEGGYYSRIFFNVQGREPEGLLPPEEYESLRDALIAKLETMTDEQGEPLGTRVFKPQEIYRECRGVPPDLIVYFGDLAWRAADSVGVGSHYLYENDTGPDDANHAQEGIFIWTPPEGAQLRDGLATGDAPETFSIYDLAPTMLKIFDIEPPEEMIGKSLL